jgi:hypothetical protein
MNFERQMLVLLNDKFFENFVARPEIKPELIDGGFFQTNENRDQSGENKSSKPTKLSHNDPLKKSKFRLFYHHASFNEQTHHFEIPLINQVKFKPKYESLMTILCNVDVLRSRSFVKDNQKPHIK